MSNTCNWVTAAGKRCTNCVLMDDFCTRHLKQKCAVCWEKVPSTNSAKTKRLTCGHSFHLDCILGWFVTSSNCPTCRASQSHDSIITFKENVEDELRDKYKDAMKTYEIEIYQLTHTVKRQEQYILQTTNT